jgi:hypothetical protein
VSVLVVARRWSFRGVFLASLVACGGNSTRREDLPGPGSGGASGSGTGTGGYCGPGGCIMGGATDPIEPPGPVLCAGVECGEGQVCCLMACASHSGVRVAFDGTCTI